jgi:DNA-binding NarL/FixJ family response regulator
MDLLISSDVCLYREGVAARLAVYPQFSVVGVADDGESTLHQVQALRPDALLLDWTFPDVTAIVRAVRNELPSAPVVVFAVPDLDHDITGLAEAGIAGYVTRSGTIDDLAVALESAIRGEFHCPPRVAASLCRRLAALSDRAAAPRETKPVLTQREIEIAKLLEIGLANKEIARALGIELATVKNHVHSILEKLQLRRRAEVMGALRRAEIGLQRTRELV